MLESAYGRFFAREFELRAIACSKELPLDLRDKGQLLSFHAAQMRHGISRIVNQL